MKYPFLNSILAEQVGGDPAQQRLTDTQKTVLVSIYASPTPEMAYDTTTGSENFVQARNLLRSSGLVVVDENASRAGVTDAGQEALRNNNLVDDIGELTEEGSAMVQNTTEDKQAFSEAQKYSTLKAII